MESKKSLYTVYAVMCSGMPETPFNIEAETMFEAITKFNEAHKVYPGSGLIYPRITKITSVEA